MTQPQAYQECSSCKVLKERVSFLEQRLAGAQELLDSAQAIFQRMQPKEMVIDLHNCNENAHVFTGEGDRCACGEKTRAR